MNGLIVILFLMIAAPITGAIIGIVKSCSSNADTRKSGRQWLLAAIILFAVEVLIGYSLCSGGGIG